MKLYAESTPRFAAQLALDVLVVAWIVLWVWVGRTVHDGTLELADPGHRISASATDLAASMSDAGRYLEDVPLVGGGISAPFDQASEASAALAAAGRAEVRAVEDLALWLGLSIALVPILVVVGRYLPARWRFVRDATAAQRYVDGPADVELFALRAMAHQPLHVLGRVTDDPVAAWRDGDRVVIERLAALELARHGLRPPPDRAPEPPAPTHPGGTIRP
jgi:hypothetical protein